MSMRAVSVKSALMPVVFGLLVAAGCQKDSKSDQKADQSAKTKQVAVDVTGMT